MVKKSRIMLPLLVFGLMTSPARAVVTTFVGEDLQPNPGATVRTNSDAAAALFNSAALGLGPVGTITFESAPLGAFTNLTVAPGVAINGTDLNGSAQTIRNTSGFPSAPSLDGSNTTSGGSRFVELLGGPLTFTFQTPTHYFGVYLTGVQTAFFADAITFNDGAAETITLAGAGTSGSRGEIAFIGFTTSGTPLTSITINAGAPGPNSPTGEDAIGVDDVSFQTSAAPEPSALALLLPVLGTVGRVLRKQRRRAESARSCVPLSPQSR